MSEDPFKDFHQVLSVDELLDIAFNKGTSKSASIPMKATSLIKAKRNEVKRIQNVNKYLLDRIKKLIQSVPNLDELHIFYRELSNLLVSNDELKKNLGKLNGIIPVLTKLESDTIRKINSETSSKGCAIARRQYFARSASILRKQTKTFKFLENARQKLKIIPTIDVTLLSVVVAGYPNVGKSSLVSKISTANPEIREYPFTTKKIIIGIYRNEDNLKLFQIIDTPGILDRPMNERNEIEKQSILALRTISNVILFIIDPSETCGYSLKNQIKLFHEIKTNFIDIVDIPYIILLNKMDISSEDQIQKAKEMLEIKGKELIQTNAKDGENFDKLIDKLKNLILNGDFFSLNLEKFGR